MNAANGSQPRVEAADLAEVLEPGAGLTVPEGVELEDLLNLPMLKPLMDDFQKLVGAVVAILDLRGRVILAVGWQDACTQFHRIHPATARDCTDSDLYLAGNVVRGQYVAYKCRNGLWDVVTPLYLGATHLGNIYTGQFFYEDEVVDAGWFEQLAAARGFDPDAYREAIGRVPRLRRDQVQTLMNFLVRLAGLISEMSLTHFLHTGLLRDQARASQAIRASEEQVRLLNSQLESRVLERTRELEAANVQLASARDAALLATRTKSEFLANMSHEIRTPMNAVIGMTHLALQTQLAPGQKDYLDKIQSAASSLLGIINEILDFSRIEAGQLALESAEFQLADLLGGCAALMAGRAAEKGIAFLLDPGPEVPPALVGDALRLGQVLTNLCSNAVKFTDRGAVTLAVRLAARDGERVQLRFSVRDTGIGIPAGKLEEIFLPFQQADSSSTRRFQGSGLGLSISRRLVAMMGGDLQVESVPGTGSVFSFTAALGVAAAPEAGRPEAGPAPPVSLVGLEVLLVEDNEFNQQVCAEILRQAGARVSIAPDGAEALARVQATAFHVVLMDLQMPVMDGFETTRRIRRLPGREALPILAMTAHALPQERERCLAVGMDGFITKPVQPKELAGILCAWLPRPAPPAPAPPAGQEDLPAALPGLDLGKGLALVGGRADLFRHSLQVFRSVAGRTGPRLHQLLATGAMEDAQRLAHSMISGAKVVGATGLSAIALALEAAIRGRDPAAWAPLADQFSQELQGILAGLQDWPPASGR